MFYDHVDIVVSSGRGGHGVVSFRREKYIPNGGPDGGNGGRGGSVWLLATKRLTTLLSFRDRRRFVAENGSDGGKNLRIGRSGEDLVVEVPVGTMVRDADSRRLIADLATDGDRVLVAPGGRGGIGNAHYKNAIRQAPRFAKAGKHGQTRTLSLELKLLADVALVGCPNAGKSTLLATITRATPKIASYPFTTLHPELGVLAHDDRQIVLADVPGLIEGAAQGAGMGVGFLRHIERSRLLLHLVDAAGLDGRDPYEDVLQIEGEMRTYNPALLDRPRWFVLTKADVANWEALEALRSRLAVHRPVYVISAVTHGGIEALTQALLDAVPSLPLPTLTDEVEARAVYRFEPEPLYTIEHGDEGLSVTGDWVKELLQSTNFTDRESLRFFERELRRTGLYDDLIDHGVKDGDVVNLAGSAFVWTF